jgi:hypothetical protein
MNCQIADRAASPANSMITARRNSGKLEFVFRRTFTGRTRPVLKHPTPPRAFANKYPEFASRKRISLRRTARRIIL